ncbi:MarR family transcriptional regulator [Nocardia sp. NPDC050710]|uniref:MarR family winged helix-turn-helix transcriptional regulator n=1 Tax=Nocardia sp. NPDC050710 TaxID=3157220 RepID=UPI003411D145
MSTNAKHEQADPRRAEVIAALDEAGRESSTVTVLFHNAVAARRGLGGTDTKSIELLIRHGPLTAKELAERSGLAPASVTGLVDRLAQRGYVRRVPHPTDKRRVVIELCADAVFGELAPLYDDWAADVHEFYREFSTEELEVVTRFLVGATVRQRAAAVRLGAELPDTAAAAGG